MEAAEQRNRAETAERRAKEMAAKDAEKTWKFAMADTKLKASQRQACELSAQMKVARAKEVGTLMKRASSEAESEKLKGQLESAQAEADAAQKLALSKRAAAERAAELEACASKQLHWALLQSNQRLARARLTDIVKEKDEEEAVAPSAAEPSLSEVEREVVDALKRSKELLGCSLIRNNVRRLRRRSGTTSLATPSRKCRGTCRGELGDPYACRIWGAARSRAL